MSMPSAAGRSSHGTYRFEEHGGTDSTSKGNYLLRPGCGAEVWSPPYKEGGTMTIRLLPMLDPETGRLTPYRRSTGPNMFGDWIRHFPAARRMGDPPCTFIYKDTRDQSADGTATPGWVLYRAVEQLVRSRQDPGWGGYLLSSAGKSALLPKPDEVFLASAAIVEYNGKIKMTGTQAGDPQIIVEITRGLGKSLLEQLNATTPNFNGDPNDYSQSMANGNPLDLAFGKFITIYRKADGDPRQRGQQQLVGMPTIGGTRPQFNQGGGGNGQVAGFDCFLSDSFNGMTPNWSQGEAFFTQRAKTWDDILYFPTVLEQADLLARKFPPNMITYAWRDHPDWIPEDIQRAAVAAHSLSMGGYGGVVGALPGAIQFGGGPGPQPGGFSPPGQFGAPAGFQPGGVSGGFSGPPGQVGAITGFQPGGVPGGFSGPPGLAPAGAPPAGFSGAPAYGQPPQFGQGPQGFGAPGAIPQFGQGPQPQFGQPQFGQPAAAPAPAPSFGQPGASPQPAFGQPGGSPQPSFGQPPMTPFGAAQPAAAPQQFGQSPPGFQPQGQPNFGAPQGAPGVPAPGGWPLTNTAAPPPGDVSVPPGSIPAGVGPATPPTGQQPYAAPGGVPGQPPMVAPTPGAAMGGVGGALMAAREHIQRT